MAPEVDMVDAYVKVGEWGAVGEPDEPARDGSKLGASSVTAVVVVTVHDARRHFNSASDICKRDCKVSTIRAKVATSCFSVVTLAALARDEVGTDRIGVGSCRSDTTRETPVLLFQKKKKGRSGGFS